MLERPFLLFAIIATLIFLVAPSCNRSYVEYVDPVTSLLHRDSLFITGAYFPSNNLISYCYSTDQSETFHGNFVWNRFYSNETPELTTHFTSELYESSDYVSGRFAEGELDGRIILMRLGASSPELDDIDTVGMYTYRKGKLHGDFYLAHRSSIRCKGTYDNDSLVGAFYQLEGRGTFNGMNIGNYARWELNFKEGKYDSLQTLYLNDTIAEQVWYEAGKLSYIINGNKDGGYYVSSDSGFAYRLNRSSLYYSLIGRSLEKDHTDRVRSALFGDSGFSGSINFCEGMICNSQFTVDRIIDHKSGTVRTETFTCDNS